MIGKKRILIAPLDWGLGHATRCIPIITQLLVAGHEVFIAAEGKMKALLQLEFPGLTFLSLHGYNIQYGRKKWGLMVNIFFQIPKILSAIKKENEWLKKAADQYRFDLVIADNRYGLHHPSIQSVFITHQLLIRSPLFQKLLQKINYKFINQFHQCWIPDYEKTPGLAGILSHPAQMPKAPVHYIGPLSRFKYTVEQKNKKHLLILLSGPEPQRTLLEEKILLQLEGLSDPVLFVRGLPGETSLPLGKQHVQIVNHLSAKELQVAIETAYLVVARAGYSTVMDLIALRQKSILIPTPGQTEQEYLAVHLMKNGFAYSVEQYKLQLDKAIAESKSFNYQFISQSTEDLLAQKIDSLFQYNAVLQKED